MSCDSRVRNRISPIQMNSGRAVSVQLDDEPQIVTAIASPAGRELNSCMPIQATPESVRPIQTPLARIRNSETISSAVIAKSLMRSLAASFVAQRFSARRPRRLRLAAHLEHQLVDEGDRETTAPSAIASCGSHSGVASLPVEMSWKVYDCQARRTL